MLKKKKVINVDSFPFDLGDEQPNLKTIEGKVKAACNRCKDRDKRGNSDLIGLD